MKHAEPARLILAEAKSALGDLAKTAIDAGQFDDAATLARVAEEISALESALNGYPPNGLVESSSTPEPQRPVRRAGRKRRHSGKSKSRKSGYPRFLRDDNRLIKVAWSKAHKKEYEHRAPRSVVDQLVAAVCAHGNEFSMDQLLPLTDDTSGDEIPSYQAYLALAWLRAVKAIEPDGRSKYRCNATAIENGEIERHWLSLPTKDSTQTD